MMYVSVIALCFAPVFANYREFAFTNHDLCKSGKDGKGLQLGKSAALLTLDIADQADSHTCFIKLRTDKGFGLMAYVEDMNLQRIGYKCKEYLQFGRDDILPFITLNKSKKLCGNRTSFFYDEPDGKLLIWLHLSSTRYSENKVKKLNIVITPYIEAEKAEASTDYRSCMSGDRAIRKIYFCDQRINCALDRTVFGDERPEICRHVPGRNGEKIDVDQPAMWTPPLNLVSITLVLVSGVVVLVIVLLLVTRLRRFGLCCYKNRRASCNLPEGVTSNNRAVGLGGGGSGAGAVVLVPHDQGGGSDTMWETQLLPLNYMSDGGARPRDVRGTTPVDSEPPPAYHDLFPPGFKFDPDKVNAIIESSLSMADTSVKQDNCTAALHPQSSHVEAMSLHSGGLVHHNEPIAGTHQNDDELHQIDKNLALQSSSHSDSNP